MTSVIRYMVENGTESLAISYPSVIGHTYQLFEGTTLGSWEIVGQEVTGNGEVLNWDVSVPAEPSFFKFKYPLLTDCQAAR